MAKQLLTESFVVQLQLNENNERGMIVAKGQFGKADSPTANNRVYPRHLWERELQKLIPRMRENEVYGELDHPCLADDDFIVATIEYPYSSFNELIHFKHFRDIKKGDLVFSLIDGKKHISSVIDIINETYDGKVFLVKGKKINSTFTPNHKFLLLKDGKYFYATLKEIYENYKDFKGCIIPSEHPANNIVLDDDIEIIPKDHNGNIYCLKVTHGNFYMEQNGHSFWTGNSDGSTKLSRVSHLVRNAELTDDGLIIGEAVILPDTKNGKQLLAILKNGGKVGVSSRGFGSVQTNNEGMDIVQDDFNLMTWDFVADPAASGSYPKFTTEENDIPKVIIKEDEMKKTENTEKIQEAFLDKEEIKSENPLKDKENEEKDTGHSQGTDVANDHVNKMEATINKIRQEESVKAINKLNEMLKEREESIKESIRSELASDPEIAGAKLALENVKNTLRPYIIGEDISAEIKSKESFIENLENEKKAMNEQLEEYSNITKELGFKLQVEKTLNDNDFTVEEKKEIRKEIGDVTRFESLSQIEKNLGEIVSKVNERKSRYVSSMESVKQQVEEIKKDNERLKASYKEALNIAEGYAIKAYANERLIGNPKAMTILRMIEQKQLKTTNDVDELIEQYSSFVPKKESLVDKINKRKSMKTNLVEDQIKKTFPKQRLPEKEVLPGITMGKIIEETNKMNIN